MICNVCNEVLEFCDPRIQQIKTTMGGLMQFKITNHSLYLFGQPEVDANNQCLSCKKLVKQD
jgi:Fur family ferric uptake transcriptional regulator